MYRKFPPVLWSSLIISCSTFQLMGDEEKPEKIMELVSETEKYSARIIRNKDATEKEKKEDRKRRRIGLGESVKITLTSKKAALLEPKNKIRWKVTNGKKLLDGELLKDDAEPESATFRINHLASKEQIQEVQKTGGLVIEVETQQGIALPDPITFEVVFPEQLTAEHGVLEGKRGMPMAKFPRDGDKDPGVSARLIVSIHPMDVCYEGIWVIEKDRGFEGPTGSLAGPHIANGTWHIMNDNRFDNYDEVGIQESKKTLNEIEGTDAAGNPVYKHSYPNEFTWKCLFRTCTPYHLSGISDIATVYQRFHIDRREGDQFYMRIKKFLIDPNKHDECSVERTSKGNHIFIP